MTKSRGWMFTIFPTPTNLTAIDTALKLIPCEWIVYQTEVSPKTKKLHFQGAIYFKTPRTLGGTKKRFLDPKVHLDAMKGTCTQALTYCTKTETRATGVRFLTYQHGQLPMQGVRVDLKNLLAFSKDHTELQCWEEYPLGMMKYWKAVSRFQTLNLTPQTIRPTTKVYYGPTGTGKSHACMIGASNGLLSTRGSRPYFSMLTPATAGVVPWMDGFIGQKDVVIEDFDGTINYRIFLRMLDHYPNQMQIKGGMVEFAPKRIWISSNKHPRDWYPMEKYEGGPLERRLQKDETGHIYEKTNVFNRTLL